MVQCRRGLGSARLHLSDAAEERGERTDLLSQVTGSVTVTQKSASKGEDDAVPHDAVLGVDAQQDGAHRLSEAVRGEDRGGVAEVDADASPLDDRERRVPNVDGERRGAVCDGIGFGQAGAGAGAACTPAPPPPADG